MDALDRLLMNLYNRELTDLLEDDANFTYTIAYLIQENVYNNDQDSVINTIFNSNISLRALLNIQKTQQSNTIAKQFTETKKDEFWQNLIENVKEKRREELSKVPILENDQHKKEELNSFRIPLKMLNKLNNSEDEFEEDKVFERIFDENEEKTNKWLITGKSGLGKTLQRQQVIWNWSNGVTNQNKLLLSVDVSKIEESDKKLATVVKKQNFNREMFNYISEKALESLLEQENSGIILLIDLDKECQLQKYFLRKYLLRNKYPNKTIVWLESLRDFDLKANATAIYELLKFDKKQIKKFYRKILKEESDELLKFNTELKKLSRIPKIAMIISILWREKREEFNDKTPYSVLDQIFKYGNSLEPTKSEENFFHTCFNNMIGEENEPIQEFDRLDEIVNCYSNVICKIIDPNSTPEAVEYKLQFDSNFIVEYFSTKHLKIQFTNWKKATEGDQGVDITYNILKVIEKTENPKIYNILSFLEKYCFDTYMELLDKSAMKYRMFNDKKLKELILGNDNPKKLSITEENLNAYKSGIIFRRFHCRLESLRLTKCEFREEEKDCGRKGFFERINICQHLEQIIFKDDEIDHYNLEMNIHKLLISVLQLKKLKNVIYKTLSTTKEIKKYSVEVSESKLSDKDNNSITRTILLTNVKEKYGLRFDLEYSGQKIIGLYYDSICNRDKITTGFVKMIRDIETLEFMTINNKILTIEFCKEFFEIIEKCKLSKKVNILNCEILEIYKQFFDCCNKHISNNNFAFNKTDNSNVTMRNYSSIYKDFPDSYMMSFNPNPSSLPDREKENKDDEKLNEISIVKIDNSPKILLNSNNDGEMFQIIPTKNEREKHNLKKPLKYIKNAMGKNLITFSEIPYHPGASFEEKNKFFLKYMESSEEEKEENYLNDEIDKSKVSMAYLLKNNTIHKISMTNFNMTGFLQVFQNFMKNSYQQLKYFHLKNVIINDNISSILSTCFASLNGLESIKFIDVKFLDTSMQILWYGFNSIKNNIKEFSIENCYLNKDGCHILSHMIKELNQLECLHISGIVCLDFEYLKIFELRSEQLKNINLSKCHLNHHYQYKSLINLMKRLHFLTEVDLSYTTQFCGQFEKVFKSVMKSLKCLKTINLSYCKLNNNNFNFFCEYFIKRTLKLENLILSGNEINENTCSKLFESLIESSTKTLKILKINDCKLKISEINELSKFLLKSQCLKVLWLQDNIEINEKKMCKIFKGLSKSASKKTLLKLNVSNCNLSRKSLKALWKLFKTLSNIQSIILSGNEEVGRHFEILYSNITPNQINLLYLDISNCNIRNIKDIKDRDIQDYLLKDLSLSNFHVLKKCVTSEFQENQDLNTFINILKKIPHLEIEYLDCQQFVCRDVKKLFENLSKDLQRIYSLEKDDDDDRLNHFKKCLLEVSLSSENEDVKKFKELLLEDFRNHALEKMKNFFIAFRKLKYLNLSYNEFCMDIIISSIAKSCAPFLHFLIMRSCKFSEKEKAQQLSQLFMYCRSLHYLDMSFNENLFKQEDYNNDKNHCLSKLSFCCSPLQSLKFNSCNLNDTDGDYLAKLLEKCQNINEIDIGNNGDISNSLSKIFTSLLHSHNNLKILNINNCEISDKCCTELCQLFEYCYYLEEVYITFGTRSIEESDSLKEDNKSGQLFSDIFEHLINSSLSLRVLHLSGHIIEKDIDNIVRFLIECPNLKDLNLNFDPKIRWLIFKQLIKIISSKSFYDLKFFPWIVEAKMKMLKTVENETFKFTFGENLHLTEWNELLEITSNCHIQYLDSIKFLKEIKYLHSETLQTKIISRNIIQLKCAQFFNQLYMPLNLLQVKPNLYKSSKRLVDVEFLKCIAGSATAIFMVD
ncbi:DgyrCDS14929 [Dimorphilus gyrociliatus]|uniref:DgyrCDS14929 n=1 Tax=Dimorphilus gyrociliatus TaxID=2664684 RepID=A0A7I8WFQ6_9ANNE|nr:DgyrCDS14929 [Dimorphilus gyrociliatus]